MQYPIIDLLKDVGGESVTGKNLISSPSATLANNIYFALENPIAGNYVFSVTGGLITGMYASYSDEETMPDIISGANWTEVGRQYLTSAIAFTLTENHKWLKVMTYEQNGVIERDYQLELGNIATAYEPYFSITFPQLSADDIAHRLKLPMLKYYPHAVIEALQTVKNGETLTYEQYVVLKHYLTPLGIGGI